MIRKDFIRSASLLVGGATIAPLTGWADGLTDSAGSIKLKKGLGFGMIQEDLPLIDKFKLVKDLGFDGIEFNSPLEFGVKELISAKEKSGVAIPSTVNKDHWSKPLSDPDPSVRQYTIDSVARSLQETKELGGDTVLVVPGVVNEKVSYEQAYNNALHSIRELIPYAEKTGIKIGLENVWNNFILSPMEAKRFIDLIDHPLVGWYFDIGNILRYGWPEHWIETLNRQIVKLHIKEFSKEKMNNEGLRKGFDVEIGKGDVDWSKVLKALETVGYGGQWIIAEVKGGDRNHLRKISQQMDDVLSIRDENQ